MKMAYMSYDRLGNKDYRLPPIILIHQGMDNKETWYQVAQPIANFTGRKVYAVDMRNHGATGWSDDFKQEEFAADLIEFMEYHGIPKAVFIGGTLLVQAVFVLALQRPTLVEKFISLDWSVKVYDEETLKILKVISNETKEILSRIPKEVDVETAKKFLALFLLDVLPSDYVPRHNRKERMYRYYDVQKLEDGSFALRGNLDLFNKTISKFNKEKEKLKGVYQGEALFLYGSIPTFIRKGQDEVPTKKLFPNAQFLEMPTTGYFISQGVPKDFLRVAVNFINGQPLNTPLPKSKY